jgi:hypothetical protein
MVPEWFVVTPVALPHFSQSVAMKPSILLIEDDNDMRELVAGHLEHGGFDVHRADDETTGMLQNVVQTTQRPTSSVSRAADSVRALPCGGTSSEVDRDRLDCDHVRAHHEYVHALGSRFEHGSQSGQPSVWEGPRQVSYGQSPPWPHC